MRQSREQLEQEIKRLQSQNDLLTLYLYDTTNHRAPDAIAREPIYKEPNHAWQGKLYRATGAAGGYVVMAYCQPSGDDAWIYYLDEQNAKFRSVSSVETLTYRVVLERLTRERNRLVELHVCKA